MAAAYQTGSATGPNDLINILATWLAGQGWTEDSRISDGSGLRLHMHKGSDYVNFRSAINESIFPNVQLAATYGIGLYMGTGYAGGSAWDQQAGRPIESGGTDTVGSFMRLDSGALTAYHFFDDGSDNVIVVVERSGELYTHMGFGVTLDKLGAWTGGPYFFAALSSRYGASANVNGDPNNNASAPFGMAMLTGTTSLSVFGYPAFVRADVDTFTGKWLGCSDNDSIGSHGFTGKRGHSGMEYGDTQNISPDAIPHFARLIRRTVSNFNNQAVMYPIRIHAERDAGGYSPLGTLPRVFMTSAVGNGFVAASIETVDGKNYMMFPNFSVRKLA